jgi:acetolactate decarboxylase
MGFYGRKTLLRALLLCTITLATAGVTARAEADPQLYAYSTIDALLAGAYDGELTIEQLGTKGDFGIGTFNGLEGELIALDGLFYRAQADGSLVAAKPGDQTPLAYVTRFRATQTFRPGASMSLVDLEKWLDEQMQNLNMFYAVRIEGAFRDVSVRAVTHQVKPYRPLAEVISTQSIHDHTSTRGVLIGIRSPAFSKGISVPGYHWHFLTEDRKHGGHVLKLTLVEGTAGLATLGGLELELPRTEGFALADQTKDRSIETKRVEGK